MITEFKKPVEAKVLEHKSLIKRAASIYANSTDSTISSLCHMFNVSGNTLASWFTEGIRKGYIANDSLCDAIIDKHVAEYESVYCIKNSSLRQLYQDAMYDRMRIQHKSIFPSVTA